jgi:uncharacterized damage-inducible protein DinB
MSELAAEFARVTIQHLETEYVPRLGRALATLPEADLWWRPHPNTTSAGNLLVHLEGNVRMWILSGLGGVEFGRDRSAEFARTDGGTKRELFEALAATVNEACAVISSLSKTDLSAPRTIQGFGTTGLGAVYHVVEHFSWHVGQVVWIAKMRGGPEHEISFHDDASLNKRER